LTQATNGLIYGTSTSGGINNSGQVFSYNINTGIFKSVISFDIYPNPLGVTPTGSVIQATNGLLYGTTYGGGPTPPGSGTVFSYDPVSGKDTMLYAFHAPKYSNGDAFMQDVNTGMMYAMIYSVYIIQLDPTTGNVSFVDTLPYGGKGTLTMARFDNSLTDSISGMIYFDNNHNCVYDSSDSPAPNVVVNAIYGGNIWSTAVSNNNGYYVFNNLPKGYSFTIQIEGASQQGYKVICPASGYINAVSSSSGNNLAIKCSAGFDLTGNLGICLYGINKYRADITACMYNTLCQPVNCAMKLVLDSALHPYYYIPLILPSVIGDTLIWKYGFMGPGSLLQNGCVEILADIDSLPPGDSISVTFIATPISGDSVPANNIIKCKIPANKQGCSGYPYDPNGKTVSPLGNISATQRLTYTIHFQNTGTAPAHNVVVMDTLSPYL
ncbi:MAG TPA: choice-of-anchor tandem repeat GloVer-containing protein, partial [Bacteroidia bacterium]|nr:choice-of-anchor tandem repeat GloVer-containing protein [Bacteroidia bacterium]